MKHLTLGSCLLGLAFTASAQSAELGGEDASSFSGKVLETTNAAGYTYVLVDTGKTKRWAAGTQCAVKTGDTVTVAGGMPMENFHSKAMNRDFPVIYFTGRIAVNGATAAAESELPPGHPDISSGQLPKNHPPIAGHDSAQKPDLSGIKPATGGKTIAEIYADKKKIGGKTVLVRGKVVKYNAEIMGKNWLHLQDGTGQPGSNDLVVTSTGEAKLGDTVLVEGKVATDKDFGAGYKFGVIVEDAKLTVE